MEVPYFQTKRRWFPRLVSDSEYSLMKAYPIIPRDSLIICHQGKEFRSFSLFSPLYLFGKEILSNRPLERTYYEVILGQSYQKPYFDIDVDRLLTSDEENELLTSLKESIIQCDNRIKSEDILLYSSHGLKKMSFHVVVNNWCFPDVDANRFFCHKVVANIPDKVKTKSYIDDLVYKSIQQFRTFGSTKVGQDRTKIVYGSQNHKSLSRESFFHLLLSSLVSNTSSCKVLGYEIPDKKIWNHSEDLDLTKEELDIVQGLSILTDGTFSLLEVKKRLIVLKRHKPSHCCICDRVHENENPYLTFSNCGNIIYFNCRRTAGKKIIYQKASKITTEETGSDFLKKFLGRS